MHAGNNRASEKTDMTFAYALESLKFHNSVCYSIFNKKMLKSSPSEYNNELKKRRNKISIYKQQKWKSSE